MNLEQSLDGFGEDCFNYGIPGTSATDQHTKTTAIDPLSERSESFDDYPIGAIIKSMMFSYGDSEEICESCFNFMANLVRVLCWKLYALC